MDDTTKSPPSFRQIAHYLLGIPAFIGIALILVFLNKSAESPLSERPVGELALESWTAAIEGIPAVMPVDWSASDEADPESLEDLDGPTRESWAKTNAFILSCTILVLLGGLGIALSTSGSTSGEPRFFPLLRFGAVVPVVLAAWFLWGFNLAFPGDHVGPFPRFHFGFPYSDPVEYGMGGMSVWTDFFYITVYAVLLAALILSFGAARITAKSLFLLALPIATLVFPFVLSWKWGGGWVDLLGNNSDFAGSALVHWHVGLVALVAGGLLTLFRRESGQAGENSAARSSLLLVGLGGGLYFLGLIGMNVGSTLDGDPVPVAAVLQATLVAALVSGVLGLVWWAFFWNRSPVEMLFIGLVSGAVAVSGAADALDWTRVILLGCLSGVLVPGLVVWFDRIGWIDPLAVGPVHGVAGFIGTIGASWGVFGKDYLVTFIGQLLLVFVVPLGAVLLAFAVLLIGGATGFLFVGDKISPAPSEEGRKGSPPPLPRR